MLTNDSRFLEHSKHFIHGKVMYNTNHRTNMEFLSGLNYDDVSEDIRKTGIICTIGKECEIFEFDLVILKRTCLWFSTHSS